MQDIVRRQLQEFAAWVGDSDIGTENRNLLAKLELATKVVTFFVVGDIAAHDGHIREITGPAWPAKDGWTYQEITGAHGTVLYEGTDRSEAQRVLDAWLVCPRAEAGDYCYTHATEVRS